ncbi:MAG: CPBP family intramembrane metalloprotease [Clostridiales bacterium]|nr:CPBP family intramembrane metalloprotease [Clostridiales bacterium]
MKISETGPRKVNLFMLLYFIWYIIGVQILLGIGAYFIISFFPDISDSDYIINLMLLQDALLLLLPILLAIKLLGDRAPEVIKVKGLSVWNVIYIVMTGFLMLPVMQFISAVTSLFCPDTSEAVQEAIFSSHFSVGFLIMAVVPAVLEETMFRGLVCGGLRKFGRKRAMVLSAFYFGLFHLNGYQIPYAMFSGIILAITAEYAGTILAPILLHFTINGVQVGAYYYYNSLSDVLTESASEAEELTLTLSDVLLLGVTAAVFFVLLLLMLRGFIRYNKKRRITAEVLEAETPGAEVSEKYRFIDIFLIINVLFVGAYLVFYPYLETFLESFASAA